MDKIKADEILAAGNAEDEEVGTARKGNIRKDGTVYHVITKSWRKRRLFDTELASYRKDLLHELCIRFGITILFSVTMPTHTHDVFITPQWSILSHVMTILDSNVAKHVRKYMPDRVKGRKLVFSEDPAYVMVTDMPHLFFLGKYTFGNYLYLKNEGKTVPDSCFWMFEKGYFAEPYNGKLYRRLFGMEAPELLEFYRTHSDAEVMSYARQAFIDWTEDDNAGLFLRK